MNRFFAIIVCTSALCACGKTPSDGEHILHILSTNDVHGCYFDRAYTDGTIRNSLMAVKTRIDSVRAAAGADNVILIDAGDVLQGDNAAYYFNYVDTVSAHIWPRLAGHMSYDATVVGNHDVETGHSVYDRVGRELGRAGIPFLGGNALRNDNGKPYFGAVAILHKAGLKVAVLGYSNANIKAWLDESVWEGMHFESLIPLVQQDVDAVMATEHPQVVIVAAHSGTGNGDGSILESQGKDLFQSLKGVDCVICAHDHKPLAVTADGICLLNSGSHCRNIGHAVISVNVSKGQVSSKAIEAGLITVDATKTDKQMSGDFEVDFEAVRAFTMQKVGDLKCDLVTAESYKGMSDYMNLIHTVSLQASGARISFAAPLTYDGTVTAGTLIFNDMFTIYPFENQLYVMKLSGREIKDYLENSYDRWIQSGGDHILKIERKDDPRTGQSGWSFVERAYNFDSAAGIVYTVDVTRPKSERVSIMSMASGEPFSENEMYTVAMTSYRANGGGGLIHEGTGLSPEEASERITQKLPELRNLIYNYIKQNGDIDPESIGDRTIIGNWRFIPEPLATKALRQDCALLFGSRD